MPKGEKSLWDIAIHEKEHKEEEAKKNEVQTEQNSSSTECTILFMGSKSAGKTSIILRFLEKDEPPKATTALEYTFGRRAKGHNMAKDVAHIWELGGGTFLSQLVETPITEVTLSSAAAVLVLDLSHPYEIWNTMETLLKAALNRIEHVISKVSAEDPRIYDRIKAKSWRRIGEDHPDKDILDPFPIPLVIIGSKYDVFQDFDSEKRKVICKTMRFLAHNYGAALQFCSNKTDALMLRTKAYVSHLAFGTQISTSTKNLNFDPNKPIMVPFGMDAMQQIGLPPVADSDLGHVNARSPMDLWKQAFTSFFPQQSVGDHTVADDPTKDPQYIEPAVDNMREQKDKELERYRRQVERKTKERAMVNGMGDVIW
ncbi:cytoplasmic dynein 2 light intermediate chain 1-like [Amphiura filiformis]|uniref:cytoplasmic dynein 2 light intermediate chain 1-like n=1 Tax=Amphiura filiformis TaxID=82378 RepID=UPI003B210C13